MKKIARESLYGDEKFTRTFTRLKLQRVMFSVMYKVIDAFKEKKAYHLFREILSESVVPKILSVSAAVGT